MAPKKKTKKTETQQPEPIPSGDETPKRERPGKASLNTWIDEKIRATLDDYIEKTRPRPNVTSVVEAALEKFFADVGFWPPPSQQE